MGMKYKLRHNKVTLMGDTHQYGQTIKVLLSMPDSVDAVFLGDGGEGFQGEHEDKKYLYRIDEVCHNKDIQLYYIRGNHSNPAVWKRNYKFSNLVLLNDYDVLEFPHGATALCVGGGYSIDQMMRRAGIDYWPGELTPYRKTTEPHPILFAHDAPEYFNHPTESLGRYGLPVDMVAEARKQREVMCQIVEDIKPRYVFSGHFHNSVHEKLGDIEYRCVGINETYEFEV